MVTSLQNPMSVKSKMECISSSSAAYCGPTSGHQELARQKEKLKETKLEHCRRCLMKVWSSYYYFPTQTNYIWLLQPAPTKIDILTQCWDVENRSASGCISSVPALARCWCWATKSCAVLMVASASCRHPSCSEHPLITTCTAAPARYIQIPDTVHTTDTRASNEGSWRFHNHGEGPF